MRSRSGKLLQHSAVAPNVAEQLCTGCGLCLDACAHGASAFVREVVIDPVKCAGCGRCISVCPVKAVKGAGTRTHPW